MLGGCGKGEFLTRLVERTGARGIGIDPSFRPERAASGASLTFIQDWYGPAYMPISPRTSSAAGTRSSISRTCSASPGSCGRPSATGPVSLSSSVPDTRRVLAKLAFWDIYYEHSSYFTAGSLAQLFADRGLRRRGRCAQGLQRPVSAARGAPAGGSGRPR
ncbi:MAG: hypothetical protein R3D25_17730 [Geminicoccaceae bacterium]